MSLPSCPAKAKIVPGSGKANPKVSFFGPLSDARRKQMMKAILALATLALVTLVLEEKGRQVAGEAKDAYGEAVVQARDAAQSYAKA